MTGEWINPERVEAGQVWLWDGDATAPASGPHSVVRVSGVEASFADGDSCAGLRWMLSLPQWRCVGYQVDDGRRVMVGDRFDAWTVGAGVMSVRGVLRFGEVAARFEKDGSTGKLRAQYILDKYTRIEAVGDASTALASLAEVTGAPLDAQAAIYGMDAERWRREAPRRAIDAMLADDARLYPAFVKARWAGVLAAFEGQRNLHQSAAPEILVWLRDYEDRRGIRRLPRAGADNEAKAWGRTNASMTAVWCALDAYERARGAR